MTEQFLAGDLGGSRMTAALIDDLGTIVVQETRPTQAADGIAAVTERFASLLHQVAEQAGDHLLLACGVAVPGLVDSRAGDIRYAANFPGAQDYPLRQQLEANLLMPVAIDNDLRLHALGERTYGGAKDCRDFLFVAVGSGVGGALFLNGEVYLGARRYAGEIGHITIDARSDAPVCSCGRRGCLEVFASGPAIAAHYHRLVAEANLPPESPATSLKDIAQWIDQTDLRGEMTRAAIGFGAQALGRGLSIAANLLDPERIILGGGVSRIGAFWLDAVRKEMNRFALNPYEDSAIQLAQLGDKAGLIGASVHASQFVRKVDGH